MVIVFSRELPTRLHHAGDFTLLNQLSKTDAAQPELADVASRASAQPATIADAHFVLAPLFSVGHALFGHV
jgi:hypothetical protein